MAERHSASREMIDRRDKRIRELEAALREIAQMTPGKVTDEFMQGPAVLFSACQRIAREVLRERKL